MIILRSFDQGHKGLERKQPIAAYLESAQNVSTSHNPPWEVLNLNPQKDQMLQSKQPILANRNIIYVDMEMSIN